MKAPIRSIIPAACLAGVLLVGLAISSGAQDESGEVLAAISEDQEKGLSTRCSELTVKGRYAFALQGNVASIGPIAASGTTTFDGKRLANITGFINTTSGAPAIRASIDGTYTVNPQACTGSATFKIPAPGLFKRFTELRFEAVIVNRGEEIRYLITTPGIVFAGSSVRQSPRSSPQ
jgi:hypothetical protein